MVNQKGFLGPIGDDLPSLIPIIFGLVIFFAVFNTGFQAFQNKSRDFDVVLIDTSGRDALSEDLVKEIEELNKEIKKNWLFSQFFSL